MKRALVIVALAALAFGGCYNPTFDNPSCPTGECPSGFTCVQGQCVSNGGDDDGGEIDAPSVDAIDAPGVDAPDTGTGAIHLGTIVVSENAVLSAAAGVSFIGQGIILGSNFQNAATDPPVLDTTGGTGLNGCRVYVRDTSAELAAVGGIDEGAVNVLVSNNAGLAIPVFPSCTFSATGADGVAGYLCPDLASSGTISGLGVNVSPMGPSAATLTFNSGSPGFNADDVGRTLRFNGTGNSLFDGRDLSIIQAVNSTTVVVVLVGATTSNLANGTFTTLAGFGITPSLADSGHLGDSASVTVNGGSGGGMHFGSFTALISNIGDDFTVDTINADRLRAIPNTGAAFSFACETCGAATVNVIDMITTDTSVAGRDSYAFPRPTARSVRVTCNVLGGSVVNVPGNVAAFLTPAMSGRTRVQTAFLRLEVVIPTTSAGSTLNVVAGHGIVGFSTP